MIISLVTYLLLFYLSYLITVLEASSPYYCDSELCHEPDKYCCGPNICCNYVWTVWYIWLAIGTGALIVGLFIWKYVVQKSSTSSIMDKHHHYHHHQQQQQQRSHQAAMKDHNTGTHNNSQSFMYMPLNSNEIFVENQIDENTIEFNLVVPSNSRTETTAPSTSAATVPKPYMKMY